MFTAALPPLMTEAFTSAIRASCKEGDGSQQLICVVVDNRSDVSHKLRRVSVMHLYRREMNGGLLKASCPGRSV